MSIYKQKQKNSLKIVTVILLLLCLVTVFYCIFAIIEAKLTVDFVSNGFLVLINIIIIFFLTNYLLYSNYSLTDNCLIIKTALFKDKVDYSKIRKIYYFATEDELYLELYGGEEKIIKINLNGNDISIFTNELRKRIPDIQYEVSLRIDSDLE